MDDALQKMKLRLRIKADDFDADEITPLMEACKNDMKMRGVIVKDDDDPLVFQAMVLYVKAMFGYTDDADRFYNAYEKLRDSMALSGEYGSGAHELQGDSQPDTG